MGIVLGDNIDYKGKKPLDSRMLFDTIAEMKAYSENYLPDITLAFNKEDSKMYVFNRENDVDTTTGKWREFEGADGGTESVYLTQIEYDNLTQEEQDDPTKDYYIISNDQSVPSDGITLADLDDTNISSPTNKQIMQYNGTSGVWENGDVLNYGGRDANGNNIDTLTIAKYKAFSISGLVTTSNGGKKIHIQWDENQFDSSDTNKFGAMNIVANGAIPPANNYIVIRVKNNNTGNNDFFNYFWLSINRTGAQDWSGQTQMISFPVIKRRGGTVIIDPSSYGVYSTARALQINTSGMYDANNSKLAGTSANVDIELDFIDKTVFANTKTHSYTSDYAVNSETSMTSIYSDYQGIRNIGIGTTLKQMGNTTYAPTFLNAPNGVRCERKGEAATLPGGQCYTVATINLTSLLGKGKKVMIRIHNDQMPESYGTFNSRWWINEIHTSKATDSWGSNGKWAYSKAKLFAQGKDAQIIIDVDTVANETYKYLLISAFSLGPSTIQENSGWFEVYTINDDYTAVMMPNNYYTKTEIDSMVPDVTILDTYQKCITFWGDSLTAGGGWTSRLASLAGMTERNGGTGGENARTIVARQGADVMMINNKTIPASGAVTLYTRSGDVGIPTQEGYKVTPLLQGGSHVNPVKIGDITGTLAWTGSSYADQNGTWTFTRSEAGEAVTIDRPTAMTTNFDRTYNNPYLQVIFIGQNGGYSDLDDLVRQHRLMIEHAKAKYTIVLGLSSGTAESRADYETRMKKEFGRYFISLREYLSTPIYDGSNNIISCYGMADQNVEIDPTYTYGGKTTVQEIEEGTTPHQILADAVHYTSGTKIVIGDFLYKKCKELGIF